VDLLPVGFEPVLQTAPLADAAAPVPSSDEDATATADNGDATEAADADSGDGAADAEGEGEGDDTPAWRSPIGNPESTWKPEYADVREDRVVVYGSAGTDVQEFVYRIKATNAGRFTIPPVFAESLYDRGTQARAPGGGTLTVTAKP